MKKFEGFQKGINLGGWYSQCDYSQDRYDNFITEKDFEELSHWGIDHVRLPIDYNLVEDEQGNYLDDGFERIQKVIDWCVKYNLNMVLDLHKTAGYVFDASSTENTFFHNLDLQERFYRLWEKLASHYGKYSDRVAFELLNEVVEQSDSKTWNNIAHTAITRIRAIAPDTYILVGSYWNNSAQAIKDLDAPYDDKIVFNFHCYAPLMFTHQGAYWVKNMPSDYRIPFPTTIERLREDETKYLDTHFPELDTDMTGEVTLEYFEWILRDAISTAEKYDVPLYCGEYGVIELADPVSTMNWYRCINSALTKHGIGRAAWTYREMDFDLGGPRMKPILEEFKKCL